jgi:hypothetical protein
MAELLDRDGFFQLLNSFKADLNFLKEPFMAILSKEGVGDQLSKLLVNQCVFQLVLGTTMVYGSSKGKEIVIESEHDYSNDMRHN